MVKSKKYVLLKHYEGDPKRSDFEMVEEELPPLKENEILVEAEYISVDVDMRLFPTLLKFTTPSDLVGLQVARNTAYFGLLDLCKPKVGEVVVVTGAAGAVGSIAGQIAKIKGCKVIGIAGSDEKCKWLKEEMGFDVAINYKTENIQSTLKEAAPDGVDCLFDNVGGEVSTIIINQLRYGGRVTVCGFLSGYNVSVREKVSPVEEALIMSEVIMQGINVLTDKWVHRWDEGIAQVLKWMEEGKLKYSECVVEGFDKMFDTFMEVLRGEKRGKVVVKI